jgi:hypothetical protein
VCPAGQTFTGVRCEKPAGGATLPEGLPPKDPEADAEATAAPPPPPPVEDTGAVATTPDVATRLKTDCKRARGTWLEKDQYCHCPNDKVLVARRCRTLNGDVTDDACLRAPSKGKWKKGVCACEPGLVFSPARGGCVAKFTGDVAVMRRVCESSLNNGKWDAMNERCACPTGRVWVDELCQVQSRLRSKVVCESAANKGAWNADAKTCACPAGHTWLDQTCTKTAGVAPRTACQSEANRGRWDDGLGRCLCPGLTRWDAAAKACR